MYIYFSLFLASVEAQLRAELEQVRLQLKTRDEECHLLEQIRVDLESEVSELTATWRGTKNSRALIWCWYFNGFVNYQ